MKYIEKAMVARLAKVEEIKAYLAKHPNTGITVLREIFKCSSETVWDAKEAMDLRQKVKRKMATVDQMDMLLCGDLSKAMISGVWV